MYALYAAALSHLMMHQKYGVDLVADRKKVIVQVKLLNRFK